MDSSDIHTDNIEEAGDVIITSLQKSSLWTMNNKVFSYKGIELPEE